MGTWAVWCFREHFTPQDGATADSLPPPLSTPLVWIVVWDRRSILWSEAQKTIYRDILKVLGKRVGLCKTSKIKDQLYTSLLIMYIHVQYWRWESFPCLTVSPQIPTGDIMSRQFCGNHPCLKISVIIPGRQPCPMVITEMFRNGPYYHGTQCVPREFVGYRETRETFPPPILYMENLSVKISTQTDPY